MIFADQAQQRPGRPYCSIKVANSGSKSGTDEIRISGGTFTQCGPRGAMLSINIFGTGALDLMERLRDSVDQPSVVQNSFAAQGIAVEDVSDVRDLTDTSLEENVFISRAQMDVTIRYSTNVDDTAGSGEIDHVTMSGPTNAPYGAGSTQVN